MTERELAFTNLASIPCESTVTVNDSMKIVFNKDAKFGFEIPENSYKYSQQINISVHQSGHWTLEPRATSHNGLWQRIEINTEPKDIIDAMVESLLKLQADSRFKPLVDKALNTHHATLITRTKHSGSGRPSHVDW
jgi:hypothetical protein